MKSSSLALLIASTAAGAIIAACSASPDGGPLGRDYGSGSGSGGTTSSGSGSSSGGTTSSGSGSSSGGSSSGGLAPSPDAGPGSTSSAAHEYFDSTVYPTLSVCQACHVKGNAAGAPAMMDSPADTAYSELDALGLIQTNSQLLTQGSHDTGAAPALNSTQSSDITTWLGMEATERAGSAAPTNVLAKVAACASQTEWNAIGWSKLVTQPRPTENPNKCTGCNKDICAGCHDNGEYGFFMSEGSQIEPAGTTFQMTFQGSQLSTYIIKYFGLNGTTPVASNAIMLKQTAVAAGPAYSHPMFVMPAAMQTALNTFVTDTITNYTNGTCTGGADAGASEDGGP